MQGYIRTMLNLHGFPNGVQFYQHTLPGNALGVTREFDGSVGISNDGLNPFTFVNTVRHELGHDANFQRPGYDTSQSSLMAAVRDRIRNSGGMWDTAERLGWTNNLINRFGLNASEAIQEAEAHALESTYAALRWWNPAQWVNYWTARNLSNDFVSRTAGHSPEARAAAEAAAARICESMAGGLMNAGAIGLGGGAVIFQLQRACRGRCLTSRGR